MSQVNQVTLKITREEIEKTFEQAKLVCPLCLAQAFKNQTPSKKG